MGHTQEGCKINKFSKDEFVKPIDKATEKGKVTGLIVDAADGQTRTSRTGTSKGNQMEWVTKQIKASKGQKEDQRQFRTQSQPHLTNSACLKQSWRMKKVQTQVQRLAWKPGLNGRGRRQGMQRGT